MSATAVLPTIAVAFFLSVDFVTAAESGISWGTVGVAWLLSTLTTAIILVVCCVVRLQCIKARKRASLEGKSADTNGPARIFAVSGGRDSASSSRRMLPPSRQTSRLGNGAEEEEAGGGGGGVSGGGGAYGGGAAIPHDTMLGRDSTDAGALRQSRRITDVTSRWCTQNGLSEQTADALRKNGFQTFQALGSLSTDVISHLGLRDRAQQCILKRLVEELDRNRNSKHDSSGGEVPPRSARLRSNSDGGRNEQMSPGVMDPLLERPEITNGANVEETLVFTYHRPNGTGVVEDLTDGSALPHVSLRTPKCNGKVFNGLLSDRGLYELANLLGDEWLHLATLLEVPPHAVSRLRLDNPNNCRRQIAEMLRSWRDAAHGEKEQVKGQLYEALVAVDRRDIGEQLLAEQVRGSMRKQRYNAVL